MVRVKRGAISSRRRNGILHLVGSAGSSFLRFRMAKQHAIKALKHSYRGRREKKRFYRSIWMSRISAIVCASGWKYSRFCYHCRKKKMSSKSQGTSSTLYI